jgi:excisionase family DNA binding protein
VLVDEVAGHRGAAKDTFHPWIESRALPARRDGKLWKFRLSEIDEWLAPKLYGRW